jgi:methyl-accepting chemotaxis protein
VSIRPKLGTLAAISALVMCLLAGWLTWQTYQTAYDARRTAIRQQVETAGALLRWAHGQQSAGVLTQAQAQQLAISLVRGLRYGNQEYFWINDMAPRVVLHPIKPALEGQDVGGVKDPEGNPLFLRFVDTVRRQQAGYVAYLWPKPEIGRAHV